MRASRIALLLLVVTLFIVACSSDSGSDTSLAGSGSTADDDDDFADDDDDQEPLDEDDPEPVDESCTQVNDFEMGSCGDSDGDGCDDCAYGSNDPANDGLDPDGDGQCDLEIVLSTNCMTGGAAACDPDRLEACINHALVNLDRAAYSEESGNAEALEWDEALWRVAWAHSKDMCDRDFFAHDNPDGDSPFDRMNAAGIVSATKSENISYNQNSVGAQYAFMNEPTCTGHRGAILNPQLQRIGVGAYWCDALDAQMLTQNFTGNDSSISDSAYCQDIATACEVPAAPVTTALCDDQIAGFGFCPAPDDSMLALFGCPAD